MHGLFLSPPWWRLSPNVGVPTPLLSTDQTSETWETDLSRPYFLVPCSKEAGTHCPAPIFSRRFVRQPKERRQPTLVTFLLSPARVPDLPTELGLREGSFFDSWNSTVALTL